VWWGDGGGGAIPVSHTSDVIHASLTCRQHIKYQPIYKEDRRKRQPNVHVIITQGRGGMKMPLFCLCPVHSSRAYDSLNLLNQTHQRDELQLFLSPGKHIFIMWIISELNQSSQND